MPDPAYDSAEAVTLLNAYVEELDPDLDARLKAVDRLFDELANLKQTTRIESVRRGDRVTLAFYSRVANVAASEQGTVYVGPPYGKPKEIPLNYNPATGLLESPKDDEYRTPEPGKPRAKRSAVADVVSAALEILRSRG